MEIDLMVDLMEIDLMEIDLKAKDPLVVPLNTAVLPSEGAHCG